MEKNKRDIKERSFEFAVRIVRFIQKLPRNHAGYKIGGQLLEAGTSVGANVEEATGGFSVTIGDGGNPSPLGEVKILRNGRPLLVTYSSWD